MNVVINNLKNPLCGMKRNTFEVSDISMDSDKRYAVAEIFKNEVYVGLRIKSIDDDILVGEYVDQFQCWEDTILMQFFVDWSCIEYGFCKLNMWAPELANKHGGHFDHTAKRFYFDWELYKKRYEETNGVPCKKKNPNK